MNKVMAIGRLTRDPELRYSSKQTAVCTFALAIPRNSTDGADFPNVTVFGKQAENCEKYLRKGSQVAVEGSITTGSYEDKDGKKIYTCGINAQRIEFLSTAKSTDLEKENDEAVADTFESIEEDVPF